MTEVQLAAKLGIRQSAVSMLEHGELDPDDGLTARLKAWLASGGGAPKGAQKAKRGPYKRERVTIPKYQ